MVNSKDPKYSFAVHPDNGLNAPSKGLPINGNAACQFYYFLITPSFRAINKILIHFTFSLLFYYCYYFYDCYYFISYAFSQKDLMNFKIPGLHPMHPCAKTATSSLIGSCTLVRKDYLWSF